MTGDLSKLMRQEVALAKVELKEEAAKAGKASGLLGGAGAVGYLVLVFLSLALMFALDAAMPIGWAALITAVILGIVAGILSCSAGSGSSRSTPSPSRPSRR